MEVSNRKSGPSSFSASAVVTVFVTDAGIMEYVLFRWAIVSPRIFTASMEIMHPCLFSQFSIVRENLSVSVAVAGNAAIIAVKANHIDVCMNLLRIIFIFLDTECKSSPYFAYLRNRV